MYPAVSVIIPVYNGEKYLAECLGNVVNQTLKEIEIILVNDASKDSSLAVMKDCQRQFLEKVKVIDSKEILELHRREEDISVLLTAMTLWISICMRSFMQEQRRRTVIS